MTRPARQVRYDATPRAKKLQKARNVKLRAKAKAEESAFLEVDAILDYRRGVLHGLEACRNLVKHFAGGRTWSGQEIAQEITDLIEDIPTTVCVIGDALIENEVTPAADIHSLFLDRKDDIRGRGRS